MPRLLPRGDNFIEIEELGIRIALAFGETAEATPHVANIGVVDIAVDDEGNGIADAGAP
ncbi:hypothetical protein QAO71_01680 [Halopseudomonas sp. SMJS2]|uniref:hypothetical protein n=1 Tax=Halopseudomonas sp. SMJS2 TaxID=3041098 RepID=UPI002452E576|nr:hypothetical protein [Halopseudomonas sp. SMJS2]WGK61988.1 hypothetical protein QAO71_01680 [Halopseudomonas sp. SMJS2]